MNVSIDEAMLISWEASRREEDIEQWIPITISMNLLCIGIVGAAYSGRYLCLLFCFS